MNSVNNVKTKLNAEEVKRREAQQKLEELRNYLTEINDLVNRYDTLADRDKANLKIVNNQREQERLFISLGNNDRNYQYYSSQFYEIKSKIQKEESILQTINQKITSLALQMAAVSREIQQPSASRSFFSSNSR